MKSSVLIGNKKNCCGCTACRSSCPKGAISMQTDEEGFLYPSIDEKLCIDCKKCLAVCAFKKDQENGRFRQSADYYDEPLVFAVKHKDFAVRTASRSGGAFTAISDLVLKNGGVVYGCAMADNFRAVHVRATTVDERNRMRGSKYIQSDLNTVFAKVKSDLNSGFQVLFSGTSCQIAGLRSFLNKNYENLFCLDIVCHGVPSPLVWEKYIKWIEKTNRAKCVGVNFRNKEDYTWSEYVESVFLSKHGVSRQLNLKIFGELFLKDIALRLSCYKCPYKSTTHPGDITIGDFWGIENVAPSFVDGKGVSLVLINNEKGKNFFECIKNNIEYRSCLLKDSLQPQLVSQFPKPQNREEFWRDFKHKSFGYVAEKYTSFVRHGFFIDNYRRLRSLCFRVKNYLLRRSNKK